MAQKKPVKAKPKATKKTAVKTGKKTTGAKRVIFMTGFPGFIGRKLIKGALQEKPGAEVIFLVEERFISKANDDVNAIKASGGIGNASFTIMPGDITKRHLGLDKKDYQYLCSNVTDIFHLAAIYDLAVPEGLAWRVNVGGTARVIDLCYDCRNLKRHVYFSTCYVAGMRTGRILESELEMGQKHKNFYESTKYEAEVLVRGSMKDIPTIIIRPAVVVGDSRTGETQKFDGPYFGMILVDKLNLGLPLPYLGKSDAEINLVPIDFIVDATVALWLKPGVEGKTFQLADPMPMVARDVYRLIVKDITGKNPLGTIPPSLMQTALSFKFMRQLLGVPVEVLEYFNHKASYAAVETVKALEGSGVSCPYFADYLPVLLQFYKANRKNAALKWKPY